MNLIRVGEVEASELTVFQQKLERYAEVILNVGAQLQRGQTLVISASVETAELVRLIALKAYEAGAYAVKVFWSDDRIDRLRFDLAPDEAFLEEPKWYASELVEQAEKGAVFVHILSQDPDLLKGVPHDRIVNHHRTNGKAMLNFMQFLQSNKVSWCVVAASSKAWAAKVFPDVPEDEQTGKLWEAIFSAARVSSADPVAAWREHLETLKAKAAYLNEKKYRKLHYLAEGTNLTIELPESHQWLAAGDVNSKGFEFVANLPSEEVFTAPLATGVNGKVSSTKPLSYGGTIIDGFTLTFKNGRIVEVTAEKGEDVLKGLIEMDEGACYLGEIALVPHHSPISEAGILFYNALYDENASSHLAIGNAYAFSIVGGTELSEMELKVRGLNRSMVHVDIMIGSADMDIFATAEDGQIEIVFRQGNWAF
jgi:aminopeptidase